MIRRRQSGKNTVSCISANLVEISESLENSVHTICDPQTRWFYKDVTEKRWTAFNRYDSANLERKYKEFSEFRSTVAFSISWPSGLDSENELSFPQTLSSGVGDVGKVSVMCGLYDVDIVTRLCTPVYWIGDKRPIRVLRGVWFRDVGTGSPEPIEDDAVVEQLEVEYTKCYSGGIELNESKSLSSTTWYRQSPSSSTSLKSATSVPSIFDACQSAAEDGISMDETEQKPPFSCNVSHGPKSYTKRKLPLQTLKFPDSHVDFYGPDEIYLYQDSTTLYIRQKLGMQKVGTRLLRGFKEVSGSDDKPPDVTHLCFVVHGIGQKMGTNSIMKCVNDLRDSCAKLQSKYFNSAEDATKRIEFLPVEWRSSLHLDGDTVESITPAHVRGLRTTLNSSAMDIMYYTSPLYRTEISSSLLSELNRLYSLFCARNPNFESHGGEVSVIAHSLGCVLMYDLITGWNNPVYKQVAPPNSSLPTKQMEDNRVHSSSKVDRCDTHSGCFNNEVLSQSDNFRSQDGRAVRTKHASLGKSSTNLSSQKLQHLAHVSQRLETARMEVSRLEQELHSLLQPRNGANRLSSDFSDRRAITDHAILHNHSVSPGVDSNAISTSSDVSLLFKHNLQNLFCLGSPLPVFLTLRGIRPGVQPTQDSILPRHLCPRIFNVYHPADPVAYRLEPLVLRHYSSLQPAVIHRADSTDRQDYDDLPLVTTSGKEIRRNRVPYQEPVASDGATEHVSETGCGSPDTSRSSLASLVKGFFSRSAADGESLPSDPNRLADQSATTEVEPEKEGPYEDPSDLSTLTDKAAKSHVKHTVSDSSNNTSSSDLQDDEGEPAKEESPNEPSDNSLQLEHRLDFQLRASRYENLYLSILSAHTCYWSNSDIGMFILMHLLQSNQLVQSNVIK